MASKGDTAPPQACSVGDTIVLLPSNAEVGLLARTYDLHLSGIILPYLDLDLMWERDVIPHCSLSIYLFLSCQRLGLIHVALVFSSHLCLVYCAK